ncbi:hypothetical protein B0J13DRAFT_457004 [Neofusicoccum parvum]|uniref:Uncharacterized protein n=1 Tax=Neofusicoccum parvum TaxID=310453 RepID=A0ACB5RWB6_9PEZI|nr:hypothetical protein B0J13DRAFT_457004 [Neofusicoccum parvum]
MYTALNRLGFKTYHMLEAIKNPSRDLAFWSQGIDLKMAHQGSLHLPDSSPEKANGHSNGHASPDDDTTAILNGHTVTLKSSDPSLPPPYGRVEFDKLLGNFDATCDVPTALFIPDLLAAYPHALVVLTVRTPRSWARSMSTSVGVVLGWRCWSYLRLFDRSFVAPWLRLAQTIGVYLGTMNWDDEARLVAAYEAHVAEVRRLVPPERLLVFGAGEAGGCGYAWEPLCRFLGVAVPEGEAYPRINDAEGFIDIHLMLRNIAMAKMVAQLAAPVVVAAGAYWWWWSSLHAIRYIQALYIYTD